MKNNNVAKYQRQQLKINGESMAAKKKNGESGMAKNNQRSASIMAWRNGISKW
jgi:hypothetical protein